MKKKFSCIVSQLGMSECSVWSKYIVRVPGNDWKWCNLFFLRKGKNLTAGVEFLNSSAGHK